jgi:hypothetical protein
MAMEKKSLVSKKTAPATKSNSTFRISFPARWTRHRELTFCVFTLPDIIAKSKNDEHTRIPKRLNTIGPFGRRE